MAAGNWIFYTPFKQRLGEAGVPNLSTGIFRCALYFGGASNIALRELGSLGSESSGGGYPAGGKTLSNNTWTSVNASQWMWDADDVIFTASGSNLSGVLYAVIYESGGSNLLICYSKLTSTGDIDVTAGNTFTVQINASGIFRLGGGTS